MKYDWEIAKSTYLSQSRLLGAYFEAGYSLAYPLNPFYNSINRMTRLKASKMQKLLKEGIESNIVLSKVAIKNNVKAFLYNFYWKQLLEFYKGTDDEKSVVEIIDANKTLDSLTKKFHKFYAT